MKGSGAVEATAEGSFKRGDGEDSNTTTTTTTTTSSIKGGEVDAEAVVVVGGGGDHHPPNGHEQYQSSNIVEELEALQEELRTAQHLADLEFGIMPTEEEELEETIFGTPDNISSSIISITTAISNVSASSAAPTTTSYTTPNTTANTFTASSTSFTNSPTPTSPFRRPELPNSMTVLSLNALTRYCQSSPTPWDFACRCVVGGIELPTGTDIALVDTECFDILRHVFVIDIPVIKKSQGFWKRSHFEVDNTYCPVAIGTEGDIVIVEDYCLPKDFVEDLFLLGSYNGDQEQQGHSPVSHMDVIKSHHKRGIDGLGDYLSYSPIKPMDAQQQLLRREATTSPKNHAAFSRGGKLERSIVAKVGKVAKRGMEELEKLGLGGLGLESDALIETAVMGMSEDDLVRLLEKLENVLL